MRLITGAIIILAAGLLAVPMYGASARVRATAYWTQDDAARTRLIERFKQNRNTDHKAAYEAAKEFFQKYPNDSSEDAQVMKRWMTAYEKVELNPPGASSNSIENRKESDGNTGPSFIDTISWLRKQIDAATFTSRFKFDDKWVTSTTKYKIEDLKDEILRMQTEETNSNVPETIDIRNYEIPITSLKEARILEEVNFPPQIFLIFPRNSVSVSGYYIFNDGQRREDKGIVPRTETVVIGFDDKDIIPRVHKAFQHLVELNSNRKSREPF